MTDFALLESPNLISRKIQEIEKSWNFHTVRCEWWKLQGETTAQSTNSPLVIELRNWTIFGNDYIWGTVCSLKNGFMQRKENKRDVDKILDKRKSKHSVEISWFFYHSDFMWNQFSGFWKVQNLQY